MTEEKTTEEQGTEEQKVEELEPEKDQQATPIEEKKLVFAYEKKMVSQEEAANVETLRGAFSDLHSLVEKLGVDPRYKAIVFTHLEIAQQMSVKSITHQKR